MLMFNLEARRVEKASVLKRTSAAGGYGSLGAEPPAAGQFL